MERTFACGCSAEIATRSTDSLTARAQVLSERYEDCGSIVSLDSPSASCSSARLDSAAHLIPSWTAPFSPNPMALSSISPSNLLAQPPPAESSQSGSIWYLLASKLVVASQAIRNMLRADEDRKVGNSLTVSFAKQSGVARQQCRPILQDFALWELMTPWTLHLVKFTSELRSPIAEMEVATDFSAWVGRIH